MTEGQPTQTEPKERIDLRGSQGTIIGAAASITQTFVGYSAEQVSVLIAQMRRANQPRVWDGRRPYLGLTAFQEADAGFFFGREKLVEDLLGRIRIARFVCIAGPSGSGKSSLAQAGLLHALKAGRLEGAEKWLYASLSPREDPIEQLALALARMTKDPTQAAYLREHGRYAPDALHQQAETLLSHQPEQRAVIYVDQFEEVFTQTAREEVRRAFLDLLTTALECRHGRVTVLISMRSDFISQCAAYPALRELVNQQFQLVGALAPEELARTITLPALAVGVEIEPELVSQVIADMKGEPGALPLMQFALRDLFESFQPKQGQDLKLTWADYQQRGGIGQALERHANAVFGKLDAGQQEIARHVFKGLVEVSRDALETRRTVALPDLTLAGVEPDRAARVVDVLADGRLVTTEGLEGAKVITLAHEKLIEAWPWLRQLIDDDRAFMLWRGRYRADMERWQTDRDTGALLRGGLLAEAERLRDEHPQDWNASELAFLDASTAQRLAEERVAVVRSRRLRRLVFGLAAALMLALTAAWLALAQTHRVEGFSLAVQAESFARDGNLRLATLLALEARQSNPVQGQRVLEDEIPFRVPLIPARSIPAQGGSALSVAWSPDGRQIASGSYAGTITIWDAETGNLVRTLTGHSAGVRSVAWSPDSRQLASGSADNTVIVWDAETGTLVRRLRGHNWDVTSIAWSPDGRQFASGSEDDTIIIWDAETWEQTQTLVSHSGMVLDVAWSPDGRQLVSGSVDKTVIVWDIDAEVRTLIWHYGTDDDLVWSPDGRQIASEAADNTIIVREARTGGRECVLAGHSGAVNKLAWSPDGLQIASGSDDRTIIVWNARSGEKEYALTGHSGAVTRLAWSPDGRQIASGGSDDNTIIIWDTGTGNRMRTLAGHIGTGIDLLAWSPDGRQIASGADSTTIIVWDVGTGALVHTLAIDSSWVMREWSPDGRQLAWTSRDNTVIIWDAWDREQVRTLTGHDSDIAMVAWSPDSRQLASASYDKTIIIWDAWNGKPVHTLAGHNNAVYSVAWSPDGQQIVSAAGENSVIVWDARTGTRVRTLTGHHGSFCHTVVWSPDGRWIASETVFISEGPILVWDVEDGTLTHTLAWKGDDGSHPAWSPGGQHLTWWSGDNTFVIYPAVYLDPPCTWIRANLTVMEWIHYRGWAHYRPTCPDYPSQPMPSVIDSMPIRFSDVYVRHPEYLGLALQKWPLIAAAMILLLAVVVFIWGVTCLARRVRRRRKT